MNPMVRLLIALRLALGQQSLGSQGGGGRAPADQVVVWSLMPGEAVII